MTGGTLGEVIRIGRQRGSPDFENEHKTCYRLSTLCSAAGVPLTEALLAEAHASASDYSGDGGADGGICFWFEK